MWPDTIQPIVVLSACLIFLPLCILFSEMLKLTDNVNQDPMTLTGSQFQDLIEPPHGKMSFGDLRLGKSKTQTGLFSYRS